MTAVLVVLAVVVLALGVAPAVALYIADRDRPRCGHDPDCGDVR